MNIIITGDTSTWNINNFSAKRITTKFCKLIKDSDCVIYNLEGPIISTDKHYRMRYRSNLFLHHLYNLIVKITNKEQPVVISGHNILELLKLNPNTIVTLANNHIKDAGPEGLAYTLDLLNRQKIRYTGAGFNNHEAIQPLIVTREHGGVAILNLNWVSSKKWGLPIRLYNATKSDFGAAYLGIVKLKSYIHNIRKTVRHVILILHHGKMIKLGNNDPSIDYEAIKNIGASAIILHHPHSYRYNPYEKENLVLVGDFVFRDPGKTLDKDRASSLARINIENYHFELHVERFRLNDAYFV
ncbi:MAG: CapA family protein [Candidatus Helarchaeota archaeon]